MIMKYGVEKVMEPIVESLMQLEKVGCISYLVFRQRKHHCLQLHRMEWTLNLTAIWPLSVVLWQPFQPIILPHGLLVDLKPWLLRSEDVSSVWWQWMICKRRFVFCIMEYNVHVCFCVTLV